ncbi:undecaprenyl-diphosphatase [Nanobdella aerobiophila]|uniref:Undecaprenyl-diphosphatase n=1 Tax=Nanobdella aerobiophila TaxID=2586965 RepID=A0A915SID6_9ARCH|nr:undecaprenyl-diphosphate phosphatase [Nanobdella aerobiophila]BBL45572.1 undecaprenyl-diphosphatase [Nanobdella aerobiophila]
MVDISPIIIGIIQGISEWLPISSKTQVLLASSLLLKLSPSVAYTFGLFMEIGSIFSALLYFRKDIIQIFKDKILLKFVIVATVLTGLVGVPLYFISKHLLGGYYNIGIPMFILGLILIADGIYIFYTRRNIKFMEAKNISLRDMIIIGLAQGLAALPGVSRSGMTVSTMLLLGYKSEDAFKYSYILYIPAALGAFSLTLISSMHSINSVISSIDIYGLLTAIIVAFITGIFVISILLKIAKKESIYMIDFILGLVAIISSVFIFLYY